MQVLPQTAWGTFGVRSENLWDPAINISVGTAYLRLLANRYNGNTLNVIAAYNAGPTRVDRRRKLPRETRGYVRCVRRWHPVYERALK
jgi:soluble lytic murein transglycosylase